MFTGTDPVACSIEDIYIYRNLLKTPLKKKYIKIVKQFNKNAKHKIKLKTKNGLHNKQKRNVNGKIFHGHELEVLEPLSIPLKAVYRVKPISIKIPMAFFTKLEQFTWRPQEPK